MNPTFIPIPQREHLFGGFKYINNPPSASHVAYMHNENLFILEGSDLSTVERKRHSSLSSIYTDNTMNSKVIACTEGASRSLMEIRVLVPDIQKKGRLLMQSSTPLRTDGDYSNGIFGGTTLLISDLNRDIYELDLNNIRSVQAIEFSKHFPRVSPQGQRVTNDPFIIPLSSRVHLASVYADNSVSIVDFRDTSTRGASALIRLPEHQESQLPNHIANPGYTGGVKAASRAFLQSCGPCRHLDCVDNGTLRRTSMPYNCFDVTPSWEMRRDNIFAFSDVMPIILGFNTTRSRARLFDVKREQLKSEFSSGCSSMRPLYIDGMPQLVGIQGDSRKLGIVL